MKFTALVPMLQTLDLAGTCEWYVTMLGFRVADRDGDDWCRLERDAVVLMFMTNAHLGAPHATATQYVTVDDARALHATLVGRWPIEWGPDEMPYGRLEFAVKDPNGYLLSFGQDLA